MTHVLAAAERSSSSATEKDFRAIDSIESINIIDTIELIEAHRIRGMERGSIPLNFILPSFPLTIG
jgi:hypothetical protein